MARRVVRTPTKVVVTSTTKGHILKASWSSTSKRRNRSLLGGGGQCRSRRLLGDRALRDGPLEREGYLAQPTRRRKNSHRQGYRYFVDHLQSGVLGSSNSNR